MSSHAIGIHDLSFSYPGAANATLAISDLHVETGERVGLIGTSGAGKSTLLRILDGQLRGWRGTARILGTPLDTVAPPPRSLRCDIGFVFQEFALVEQSTVRQNVLNGRLGRTGVIASLFGRFSQHDERATWQAMHDVGIADLAQRRVEQLSGGQRQRVAIARCLAQQPTLILADEPVSNLDPVTARSIIALLASCARRRGVTLLISSHQPRLIGEHVDRVVALDGGKIVFDGPPEALDDDRLMKIYGNATSADTKLELVA